jgi:hypothetical protein
MKNIASTLLFLFCAITGIAQSLSINSDGSTAHPSAMLDVKSTGKGLLIPRLTSVQRIAISGPAAGLEVYDTDLNQFYFYNASSWTPISYGANANNFWTLSGGNIFNNAGTNVGIGAVAPLAKLTVEGTDDAGPQDLFKLSKVNYGSTIFYQYYTDAGNWGTKMRGSSGPAPAFIFNMVNGRFGIGTSAPSANLEVIGTVKINDGSEGVNKILTSDAAGLASWQNPTAPNSELILATHSSFGTVNTQVPRFSTVLTNTGTDLTYLDSPSNGTSITINTSGIYYVSLIAKLVWSTQPTLVMCILKNTGTFYPPLTSLNNLCFLQHYDNQSTDYFTVSSTVHLSAGDVVRPAYNITADNESRFEIRRVY